MLLSYLMQILLKHPERRLQFVLVYIERLTRVQRL